MLEQKDLLVDKVIFKVVLLVKTTKLEGFAQREGIQSLIVW